MKSINHLASQQSTLFMSGIIRPHRRKRTVLAESSSVALSLSPGTEVRVYAVIAATADKEW
jgi:hypothetical protein